ncbi:MAG: AbrB family transcriptional regulator [Rhodospirillaceae bacterium]|nr:AbrB family transcriptional regulator [Rhodospirillaceae bacterium]MBT4043943.1 AbrB family transcriptional regulator [Rhodospirillaceae bacterium]MBT4690749.1 AbrB family transcriptional regulator [Rhodospirillaceae bacterium]MBT5078954.1 AbrB family transcriptional regulator [Rhodospirillaceae bacterium]MBT5522963.1 AbrB family transcriptional regulator [Rhodospirillaceae bacterium]
MIKPSFGQITRLAFTLLLGAIGGAVFFYLDLPLAWMLGSMTFTTIAAFAGAPVRLHMPLRMAMVAVLGTLLGSAFTPHILDQLQHWGAGVLVMVVFVTTMTAASVGFLMWFGKMDRTTAYFAGTPGGLGEMTIIGEQQGGDPRTIALVHATRIFVVVFLLPLFLTTVQHLDIPNTARVLASRPTAHGGELAILAVCAVIGFFLGQYLRLPGGRILGPMSVSAAAYLSGIVHGRPPAELIAIAQVVIGSAIGARFVGLNLRQTGKPIFLAICSAIFMLAMAAIFASVIAPWLGLPMHALLLALSPGGLAEMSLIALALGVDTAFIATMHLVRILLIVTLAPIFFRVLNWGNSGK